MAKKRDYYVEIDITHEDSSYEVVGIFSNFDDFINAYNETKERLLDGDSITTIAGDTINEESGEVLGMIFNDNVEKQRVNKSFWNDTKRSVNQFYSPLYKTPPVFITKKRGVKKNSMQLYRYVCNKCHKEPNKCKCQDAFEYSLIPKNMNAQDEPDGLKEFKFLYTNDIESYVCPFCLFDIDECKCDEIPLSIIKIETWSSVIQRKFREKGYGVYFTGASNTYVEDSPLMIGIRLYTKYKFENKLPKGWKHNSNGFLTYSMKSENSKDLIIERDIAIDKLAIWIDTLPEHPEWKVVKSHSDIVSV